MDTLRQRRSPRLQGYDYSQAGAYFITICTQDRIQLFGDVVEETVRLSQAGEIAQEALICIPEYWSNRIDLDAAVVMPNHIHAILLFVGTRFCVSENTGPDERFSDVQKHPRKLGNVVNAYKGGVTRRIRAAHDMPNLRVWQARYHDHIVRDESDLTRLREYVHYNRARWEADRFYDG